MTPTAIITCKISAAESDRFTGSADIVPRGQRGLSLSVGARDEL
jgi:hypothetical protein